MATVKKITLSPSRDIPFNKLALSQANVRRIKAGVSIEELAEDIARRGLLQGLSVRAIVDEAGTDTGMFEVWGDHLATGLVNAIHMIDPGRIVLGGPLANLFPLVADHVIGRIRNELLDGFTLPHISLTRFAGEGAALGAAVLVRETIFELPDLEPSQ